MAVSLKSSTKVACHVVRNILFPVQARCNERENVQILYDTVPGTFRHLRGDGQLLGYGRCKGDQRYGPCLRVISDIA